MEVFHALLNPNVAKAEGAVDPRRPLRQAQGEAVVSYAEPLATQNMQYHRLVRLWRAFPKGKQHGCFYGFLDITRSAFRKNTQNDRKERLLATAPMKQPPPSPPPAPLGSAFPSPPAASVKLQSGNSSASVCSRVWEGIF